MSLLRSRFIVLILAAVAVFVVFFYSSSVRETVPRTAINAESFNSVLQERIEQKQQEHSILAESYDEPLSDLISRQAASFGVSIAIPESSWQKAEVSVLQGEPEQLVDWLSELATVYGIRIQSLHLLSDSSHPFSIDHLVLVR
ncbi:hypothetical protein GZ77_21335 [Endozoicomonas montiporae]|uniref:Type II secretion system protein M n=2 Tax=Endozoicomonas montiporae TaxID=1027273 RepID=A0A081N3E7_9GAMM|nr:hypothetical protein [Endozoicomonas montiporae]AMO58274.1 putative general secretion pathway protein M [Endozoicomonas montiporae CL-33]KEQ12970.1 hypothetical protein GZ77_21335 [Endozoicomonas montiporae]